MLLCGAVVLSTGTFTSCNDDDVDELKSQVAVIQTAIEDLEEQLGYALKTGASVTNVQQTASGGYNITLSDGQVIAIGAGGGSAITVTVTDTEAIIMVDGTEYRLPLGSKVTSLVYYPESIDGIVELGNDGAQVKFMARPELSSIDGAEFTIAESHELTRAGNGEQFVVSGSATLEGGIITVPIIGLSVTAGQTYAVSVQMNYLGTIIGSNFFNIHVADDFSFSAEDLVNPTFGEGVSASADGDAWTAPLPESADFLGTFSFADLVSIDGLDNVEYVLAPSSEQNGNVSSRYDFFTSCLSNDGTWTMQGRPGTDCSAQNEGEKDGLLIYLRSNYVVKAKIYWTVSNPLADAEFVAPDLTTYGSPHLEYGNEVGPIILNPGVGEYNLAEMILGDQFSERHGTAADFIAFMQSYEATLNGETVIFAAGTEFTVTQTLSQYAQHSRGLRWFNVQSSVAASNRRNWTDLTDEDRNALGYSGEIIQGWDGMSPELMAESGFGVSDEGYLVTTEAYPGWALRVGFGFEYEYDYGVFPMSSGCICYIWFNRRECAEGVVDPAPRS